jgi:hypothetical protein
MITKACLEKRKFMASLNLNAQSSSHIPALQLLCKMGYQYLRPQVSLDANKNRGFTGLENEEKPQVAPCSSKRAHWMGSPENYDNYRFKIYFSTIHLKGEIYVIITR